MPSFQVLYRLAGDADDRLRQAIVQSPRRPTATELTRSVPRLAAARPILMILEIHHVHRRLPVGIGT